MTGSRESQLQTRGFSLLQHAELFRLHPLTKCSLDHRKNVNNSRNANFKEGKRCDSLKVKIKHLLLLIGCRAITSN